MSSTSSKTRTPETALLLPDGERLVPIGELVGTHGVAGELRLRPFNPETAILHETLEIFLLAGPPRRAILERARPHGRVWLVRVDLAGSPETARELVGFEVAVRERELPPLREAEYYHYQLIGLEVVEESGAPVGVVAEVIPTAASDVLAVRTDEGERLVPVVADIVLEVDLGSRRIVIRAPKGLLDP